MKFTLVYSILFLFFVSTHASSPEETISKKISCTHGDSDYISVILEIKDIAPFLSTRTSTGAIGKLVIEIDENTKNMNGVAVYEDIEIGILGPRHAHMLEVEFPHIADQSHSGPWLYPGLILLRPDHDAE